MNTKLKTLFAMPLSAPLPGLLLGLMLISPLLQAAEHTPIIDVHMHSEYEPSTFLPGGPPFHMCHETYDIVDPTPNTKPGDPVSLEDIFHCRDKAMVSTMTDEENQQKMFEMFEKYNYKLAIDSGTNFARMADWAQKSPVKPISIKEKNYGSTPPCTHCPKKMDAFFLGIFNAIPGGVLRFSGRISVGA
jgi:hypothetical protein